MSSHHRQEGLWLGADPAPAEVIANPTYNPNAPDPHDFSGRVLVDSIHGGNCIPLQFRQSLERGNGALDTQQDFLDAYIREKDWGANQVAEMLAQKLNLPSHFRVNIARCLMDFGRFPGETPPGADHLHRFAINDLPARYLRHEQKQSLLHDCFDATSNTADEAVHGKLLKIAIHAYDRLNDTGTIRPPVSLIFQPVGYHHENRMPYGVFDRMYPDRLAEFTADRRLVARITLELEKQGIAVAYNHPYLLPEGSVELRSQVWYFFQYLRKRFEACHPDLFADPCYERVWEMLLDTNLRNTRSDQLRSYLHMFRTVPPKMRDHYAQLRQSYEHIGRFLTEQGMEEEYRRWPERPSSIVIEIRKDLIWKFADEMCRKPVMTPDGARMEQIDSLTTKLAGAIQTHLQEDRPL